MNTMLVIKYCLKTIIKWGTTVLTFTAEQTRLIQREEDAIVRRTGAEDAAQQGNGTQLCVKSWVRSPAPHQEGETALKRLPGPGHWMGVGRA